MSDFLVKSYSAHCTCMNIYIIAFLAEINIEKIVNGSKTLTKTRIVIALQHSSCYIELVADT